MQTIHIRGLALPRLTLGTVQLGLNYGIANENGKPDEARSHAILDAALAGGITSFDTAAAYGDSEAVLGHYFTARRDDTLPILTTKVRLEGEQPLSPAQVREAVRESLENSLARLGRESVDLFLLHSAEDLALHGEAVVRAMEDVKAAGLAERIGVSLYTAAEAENVLRWGCFDAIQLPLNIMDTRLTRNGTLTRLRDAGLIVFVRSVFLQGLFFRDPYTLPPFLAAAAPYLRILQTAAADEGLSVAQLAFGYVRDLPGVSSLVVGAETVEQVRDNLRLLEAPAASREVVAQLQSQFNDVPERVLNPIFWKPA